MDVSTAVDRRRSTRAFLPRPVPDAVLRDVLSRALRAPSGGNTQPWHVYVVSGDAKAALAAAAKAKALETGGVPSADAEFAVYPTAKSNPPAPPEFLPRRRKLGFTMFELMGIARDDGEARTNAMLANFDFFGAPVGLIVTVDRACDRNGWGHVGAFLMAVTLLAAERGLGSCLQEAWGNLGDTVYEHLGIDRRTEAVWCGVALGYADPAAKVNTLRSERDGFDAKVRHVATSKAKL